MLVSVWITTYNHEQYIAKALDSVLMQKTDFDVEIVIGEDCSTDNTRRIILEYNNLFPGKFILLLPERNLGMIPMFMASHPLCKGKYVAWLDGDDYWADPLKLQKQVDFLEAHPAYVMCFHNVLLLDHIQNSERIKVVPAGLEKESGVTVEVFCSHNPVAASSVVCRNVLQGELPGWFNELPYPDLAYYFLLLEKGKVKFLNEVMGVYRIHSEGAWSGENSYRQFQLLTGFYEKLDKAFKGNYKKHIIKHTTWMYFELMQAGLAQKDYLTARRCMLHIFRYDLNFAKLHKRQMLNAVVVTIFGMKRSN